MIPSFAHTLANLPGVCALGFFLGMRHATDPDHVIAVTTIVSRQRSPARAAMIGALWGVGHTVTLTLVGAGIILLGWVIPPRVGLSLELSVGVMLILLGLMNLTPLARLDRRLGRLGLYQAVRPLVVGVVHGLAGSAAVALLVLTVIGNTAWSILYLLVFGIGTIAGMMLITAGIAWPSMYAGARFARVPHRLRVASGIVSLAVGLAVAYRVGVVDGLFGEYPRWTPR
jgi:cytochrome c biogenesis protein CcdA